MKNKSIALHIGVGVFALVFCLWASKNHFMREFLLQQNQAMASELIREKKPMPRPEGFTRKKEDITPQGARDIIFLTANFLYEMELYQNADLVQVDVFRILGTSVINKKLFEKKATFEEVITEKKRNKYGNFTCQYSWYCEKGKPINLHVLRSRFKSHFDQAYEMAVDIVTGNFSRYALAETIPFDSAFYCTVAAYNAPNSWHREQVRIGKMCNRRIIDGHVHITPKIKGSCKDNQLAYFGE